MPDGIWMTPKHPIYVEMERIAQTAEGITAAVQATNRGEPASCALDTLFRAIIGAVYINEYSNTFNCGLITEALMLQLGFVSAGHGPCSKRGGMQCGILWSGHVPGRDVAAEDKWPAADIG
jgi:hypothetical protein